MLRLRAFALLAAPLAARHRRAGRRARRRPASPRCRRICARSQTMTASFTQTDRARPLADRHAHRQAPGPDPLRLWRRANMLIVGDGRRSTSSIMRSARCSAGRSAIRRSSVLLNPDQDLARFARVVPRRSAGAARRGARSAAPRIRHDHAGFAQGGGRAGGPDPAGLEHARRAEQPHHRPPVQPALQRAGRATASSPIAIRAARAARASAASRIRSSARQVAQD